MAAWYADERVRRGLPDPETASNAREICFRAERGDRLAFEAVRREGNYLGMGLANLVTLFVPDVIALGGGVMESWPLFEGQIRDVIRRSCGLVPFDRTELRRASLGEKTGLIGAARVWFHRYSEGENIDWNSSISA
jgi:glucokinase